MTTKVCTGCKFVLPVERFSMQKGRRRARCKDCEKEANKIDRSRYKARLQADIQISAIKMGGSGDPLAFSRATCEHVRLYVERAISRWERATEMEAPPHLTALRQITTGFVKEHPERRCKECGTSLQGEPSKRKFCPPCGERRHKERNRTAQRNWKLRERTRIRHQRGCLLVKQAEADLIRLFRVLGLEWQEIAERFGMSVGGVYAKANYDPQTGGTPPPSYHEHGLIRKTERLHLVSRK